MLAFLVLSAASAASSVELPARFEADLVYVEPTLPDGHALSFYTDTGGGYFIREASAANAKLALQPATAELREETGNPDARVAVLAGIGMPMPEDGVMPVMPAGGPGGLPGAREVDGMFGAPWFAGHVWRWDFAAKRLIVDAPAPAATQDRHGIAVGFKQLPGREAPLAYPRIDVTIDGRTLPMLLDTGAMTVLTPEALKALGDDGPAQRATSMITDNVFNAWHAAHPDWRVIEAAQAGTGAAMIEVPEVEIAGWRVGPVWFTYRPDANFHRFMSQFTDVRIEGAIGNNVFREFTMTVDYPGGRATFDCTGRCRDAAAPATPPPAP